MSQEDYQNLQRTVGQMKLTLDTLVRPDRYQFDKDITLFPGRSIRGLYWGAVNSGGTAVSLPSGWTSSRTAAGQYTVTHNLNLSTTGYVVLPISQGLNTYPCSVVQSANSFQVNIGNLTAGQDTDFKFFLTRISN